MLTLEVLPAGHGDCLWIEYGDPASPWRILIDGGAQGTYKRALQSRLARAKGELELLVITHVDGDHIAGVLEMIADARGSVKPRDVWFNAFRHLPNEDPETLGPLQGEKLTDYLVNQRARWNVAFDRKAAVVPDRGELPRLELAGKLALTLLSPTVQALADLRPVWLKEVRKAGLDPNMAEPQETAAEEGFELLESGTPDVEALAAVPFVEDSSEPNGSGIAMLLEFEGHRILLAADAHPGMLASAIKRHNGDQRLKLAACKIPHHGSKANVSRQLLDRLDCDTYIFSTNGAHFRHPDREGVARVIKWGGSDLKLIFNYETPFTEVWKPKYLKEQFHYDATFPEAESSQGIVLSFQ